MQSDDDEQFFKDAMANVEPLKKLAKEKIEKTIQNKNNTKQILTVKSPQKATPIPEPSKVYNFVDHEYFPFSAEQEISFSRVGFSRQNQRELRAGKWPLQATLDLHGNTVDEARGKTAQFLAQAVQRNYRCIKIIHGKGRGEQPILKNKVAQWLPQCEEVLAFCSAPPNDGGSGAVLVLLKKRL